MGYDLRWEKPSHEDGWRNSSFKGKKRVVLRRKRGEPQEQKGYVGSYYFYVKRERMQTSTLHFGKEIWETLENHYEGNIQVRSKKIQLYVYEYELFKMKPHESITEITNRLNALLITLGKLGKHYTKEEVNTKILRVLPKKK